MKQKMKSRVFLLGTLFFVAVAIMLIYLTYHTYGNWEFALALRGKKILGFIIVGVAISFSTITFQTVTHSHFLTPNILGIDALYLLIQTILFYSFGQVMYQLYPYKLLVFAVNVLIMVIMSTSLISFLLKKNGHNLFLLLMIGMILGSFLTSLSTFFQVLMDPNEFDKLQGALFASFSKVEVDLLAVSGLLLILGVSYLFRMSAHLDVLHLGQDHGINLGINVPVFQKKLLIVVSVLVAISTALVGPVTFLGFIVSNVTYSFMKEYQHKYLFIGSSLISLILLVGGQFMVEHVFHWNTTISVMIEFVGGIYFIWKTYQKGSQ